MRFFLQELCKGNREYVQQALSENLYWLIPSKKPYLKNISFHIINQCNLNCKCCSYATPFAKPWVQDPKTFEKQIQELSKKLEVLSLSVLGGEPLLHPHIAELLVILRTYYPKKRISLLTNGILLESMSPSFFECLRENNIYLKITVYPPFVRKKEEWKSLLKKYQVIFSFANNATNWLKICISFKNPGNYKELFKKCRKNMNCVVFYDGKLYLCPLFSLKHYYEYFGEHHETVRGYDIYQYNGKELVQLVNQPDPACRYCKWVEDIKKTSWDYSKRERSELCVDE